MNVHAHNGAQRPELVNRIVLLGASNLTLSLRIVIQLMQHHCGRPSDVLVAAGHGRSYGQYSQVLIRGLPGTISSGLWSNLDSANALPIYAFLTDIGNDIPYGYMPEQILEWVGWCVERLQRHAAQIIMTNVPIALIEPLSERHYRIIRAIFFPFSRLSRREVVDRARVVHRGLMEMASSKKFELCEQEPSWFGPDVIHVLSWRRKEAYRCVFERLSATNASREPVEGKAEHAAAWKQRPRFAYKKVLGRELRYQQPSGQLADGTTVSMY